MALDANVREPDERRSAALAPVWRRYPHIEAIKYHRYVTICADKEDELGDAVDTESVPGKLEWQLWHDPAAHERVA